MLLAWLLLLATTKLYLKDGTYQLVREYEVRQDRVRYYSTERGDWEEIPLDLIDLKRTKAEVEARETERKAEAEANRAEAAAERDARREIARVPEDPGAYYLRQGEFRALKRAESKVVTNKKRSVLKALSPIPIVAGKATLELDGEAAAEIITEERPEFYFRLAAEERFTIVKLTPAKGARVVEKWSIIPVTKELVQEHDEVPVFRHQVGDGLYKIWPQKPLPPGEYALIEYTEGKGNTQIWDFGVRGAARP